MYPSASIRALSDAELLSRLDDLTRQERESTADVVEHLSELDDRETALDRAYESVFHYCVAKLGYSKAEAFFRIRAARAANDYPEVIGLLRSGRIHLESIVRLYPHLTVENHGRLLKQVDGASKREVAALIATLESDPPPSRDLIIPVAATFSAPDGPGGLESAPGEVVVLEHRIHFTADDELVSMIARLKALLRHKYPDGRLEHVFKDAAQLLLETLERQRGPRKRLPPSNSGTVPRSERKGSRRVPRPVKREVWSRDQGRCSFRAGDGTLCGSREALEYDHIVPWADGGRSDTAENIRLLCRAHNQRLGRRRFGPRRPAPAAAPPAGATGGHEAT